MNLMFSGGEFITCHPDVGRGKVLCGSRRDCRSASTIHALYSQSYLGDDKDD